MPTLEEVSRLTMLPMFGDVNAIEVVLREEDEEKLCCLTSAMTTFKRSDRSTYIVQAYQAVP